MSRKNNKKIISSPSSYIDVLLGSELKKNAVILYALCCKYGFDPNLLVQWLFFDWQSKIGCTIDGTLDLEIDSFFRPEDFIEAKLPKDKESLKMAEANGDLWPMPEGWYLNPGPIGDDMGA